MTKFGFVKIAAKNLSKKDQITNKMEPTMRNIYDTCRNAVGKKVYFKGTNGDEYDKHYGEFIEGEGFCTAYHDSHGLCIMVKDSTGREICVDPCEIKIMKD